MEFTPHPFQQVAIDHAVQFLSTAAPGAKQLYAGPTGVGKSVIELKVQELLIRQGFDPWIVTPREEIIDGMLSKLGVSGDPLDYRVSTPVKLRNRLLDGRIRHPTHLLFDETHHHTATTWQQLDLLSGLAPSVGYTATPYRGSPRSTKEFLEQWGEPIWVITYEEAEREGYITMPTFEVLPLVDDDIIDVRGGEFEVTSIDSVTNDRLSDLAAHSAQWYSGRWDRPTVYACPTTVCCRRLHHELALKGIPAAIVSAETPKETRRQAFKAAVDCILAILHIDIVSEGVDYPFRRLVDLAPTLSPRRWAQQLGRITRPTKEKRPEYICTNRNFLRHAYILEGVVPAHAVAAAEKAFPRTERAHTRVLGLEAIGRFKPTSVKLVSGSYVYVYSLSVVVESVVVEYCCLVHPAMEPIWASKVNTQKDGVKQWGRWQECEAPSDVRGFSSLAPREVSPKQKAWWDRSASRYGLDQSQEVTRKSFQALPVLADIGRRLM